MKNICRTNMKKIKRALAVSLGLCTLFSNSVYAAPLGKVVEYRQKNQIGQIAEELQVSEKEIENLGTNLNHALQKTPELEAGEKVKINVSENLYLEIESYEEDDSVINNHRQNNVAKATKKRIIQLADLLEE